LSKGPSAYDIVYDANASGRTLKVFALKPLDTAPGWLLKHPSLANNSAS
jgi:hypothetical protein